MKPADALILNGLQKKETAENDFAVFPAGEEMDQDRNAYPSQGKQHGLIQKCKHELSKKSHMKINGRTIIRSSDKHSIAILSCNHFFNQITHDMGHCDMSLLYPRCIVGWYLYANIRKIFNSPLTPAHKCDCLYIH